MAFLDPIRTLHLHRLRTFLHIVFSHVDVGAPVNARSLLLDLRYASRHDAEHLANRLVEDVASVTSPTKPAELEAWAEAAGLACEILALHGGHGLPDAVRDARFDEMSYGEMQRIWDDTLSWILGSTCYAFRGDDVCRMEGAAGSEQRRGNVLHLDARLASFKTDPGGLYPRVSNTDSKARAHAQTADRRLWRNPASVIHATQNEYLKPNAVLTFGSALLPNPPHRDQDWVRPISDEQVDELFETRNHNGIDALGRIDSLKDYLRPPASDAKKASDCPSHAHLWGY